MDGWMVSFWLFRWFRFARFVLVVSVVSFRSFSFFFGGFVLVVSFGLFRWFRFARFARFGAGWFRFGRFVLVVSFGLFRWFSFGRFVLVVVSVVSFRSFRSFRCRVVSFWSFRFVVSGFSTCLTFYSSEEIFESVARSLFTINELAIPNVALYLCMKISFYAFTLKHYQTRANFVCVSNKSVNK